LKPPCERAAFLATSISVAAIMPQAIGSGKQHAISGNVGFSAKRND
jgi:hypothetical protein